jgi:large subunit ribosomal protein L22
MAVETKEYRAEAKFQRVSPQKARLVLDLIKGLGVGKALETAAFTKKRIAPVVHKLLTSAIDNAKYVTGEQGIDLDVDNLYVRQALANDGPRLKRIRPAPMGRAFRYQRRLTHIIVTVAEREPKEGRSTKTEGTKKAKVLQKAAAPKATRTAAKKTTAAESKAATKTAAKKTAVKKTAAKKTAKKAEA